MTILEAIRDPALFGPLFRNRESWRAWEALLAALFGLELTKEQLATYRRHTGRKHPPKAQAKEGWLIVGRRGGKSWMAAKPTASGNMPTATGRSLACRA